MGCGASRHIHNELNETHPLSAPVALSAPVREINLADPIVAPITTPRETINESKPRRPQPTRHVSAPSGTTLGRESPIRSDSSGSLSTTRPASALIPKGIDTSVVQRNTQPTSPQDDDPDLIALRESCPRFRILIIGRAGAGKTTILQRICNTSKPSIVHDLNGSEIDLYTDDHRTHDINSELYFSGNNAFIFHDSPGFSTHSTDEIDAVRDFIAQRAAAPNLQDQLHAIWNCLPADNERPWSDTELSFFEEGTGQVPVIAIFTKYDGMILQEYNRLRFEDGLSRKEARERAPEYADKLFGEYLEHLKSSTHPPARWLRVQDMQKEDSSESKVVDINIRKETREVLDFKRLNLLYMSVLLNICTEDALRQDIIPALGQSELSPVSQDEMTRVANRALLSYDHLKPAEHHGRDGSQDSSIASPAQQILVQVEKSTVIALAGQGTPTLQILKFGIAILIIVEDSFWCKEGRSTEKAFRFAQDQYQRSARHSAVTKEVEEHFSKVNPQEFSYQTKEKVALIQDIVKKFRAPISQEFLA